MQTCRDISRGDHKMVQVLDLHRLASFLVNQICKLLSFTKYSIIYQQIPDDYGTNDGGWSDHQDDDFLHAAGKTTGSIPESGINNKQYFMICRDGEENED